MHTHYSSNLYAHVGKKSDMFFWRPLESFSTRSSRCNSARKRITIPRLLGFCCNILVVMTADLNSSSRDTSNASSPSIPWDGASPSPYPSSSPRTTAAALKAGSIPEITAAYSREDACRLHTGTGISQLRVPFRVCMHTYRTVTDIQFGGCIHRGSTASYVDQA